MLQDITKNLEAGAHRRQYRLLVRDPSRYVHISFTGAPTTSQIIQLTEMSTVSTFSIAMNRCVSDRDIGRAARQIAESCRRVMSDMIPG